MKNKIFISVFAVSLCVPLFASANVFDSVPNLKAKANIDTKIDARIGDRTEDNDHDNRGDANMGIGASVSAEHRNDDNNSRATSTGNKDKDKNEDKEKGENKGWFGGWWSNWFGGWFNWNHGTTTPDSLIVVRSVVTSNVGTSTAEVNWNTNASTTGELRYAINVNDVKTSVNVLSDTSLSTGHKIVLSGLSPNTKYYFQITVKDALGNTKQSGIADFTTKSGASGDITAPSILFSTVLNIGTNDARILWVTDESSNGKVWVSENASVGTDGTETAGSLNLGYVHDLKVSSLKSSTKYYYKVRSVDASGNVTISAVGSFTTK